MKLLGKFINGIFILIIRFYQLVISPMLGQNKCKYIPSCSQYALEAFRTFNPIKALFLTTYRILRCNPFSKGGYDPIIKYKKQKEH